MKTILLLMACFILCLLAKGQVVDYSKVGTNSRSMMFDDDMIGQRYCMYPDHFTYNNMVFDFSYHGVRDLMNYAQINNPEMYQQLKPKFKRLRNKRTGGWIITSVFGVGGIFYGILSIDHDDDFSFDHDINQPFNYNTDFSFDHDLSSKSFDHDSKKNTTAFLIGGTISLAGVIVGALMRPNRQDIFSLINTHNVQNPGSKIDLKLGYASNVRAPQIGLCYVF